MADVAQATAPALIIKEAHVAAAHGAQVVAHMEADAQAAVDVLQSEAEAVTNIFRVDEVFCSR